MDRLEADSRGFIAYGSEPGYGANQEGFRVGYVGPPAPADFDADGDVDGDDFNTFAACVSGPAVAYLAASLPESPPGCTLTPDGDGKIAADFDLDGDVDQDDFSAFQRCYSGANTAPALNCFGVR